MKLNRLAATAAAAVLAATGLVAVSDLAQASPKHPSHFVVNYPVGLGKSRIQGNVVDQFGNRIDNVSVHATSDSGSASQLTYAQDNGGGHGFFNLTVHKGTFTLTFKKNGYESESTSGVKVGRSDVASLGKITLTKQLVKTQTTLDKGKCREKHGKTLCAITVEVGGKGVRKPTGDVTVGGLTHTLKPSDNGVWETTLVLTKTKSFNAAYDGDQKYAGSKSDSVKIKV